ncbi:hypothetical protein JDV02_001264 [Purpureocillium takamizusanense]|uniref:Potassium channel tetramerisation-type BTB domain-containing protein n=1 Tax=Purpureocillium takamizusanense TaxID=2060973 RepID=A0A9Q8V7A4_9HYPO|nr:uncharacterized protein JDV02_001264 [Purpureocillium takamizusanense]UNI14659.1 hypothetical protein JDV02_001264 [Purpureocillium takamizusanense]
MAAAPAPAGTGNDRVVVRVGEKQFFTTKTTLAPARFFATLWALAEPAATTADGGGEECECYFVDGDAGLFEHVLCFLRTRRFPLFYSRQQGFDQGLYLALLQQARFYQVQALEAWIAEKRCLDAVWISSRAVSDTLYGDRQFLHMQEKLWASAEEAQVLSLKETGSASKQWRCPGNVWKHDGNRLACHRARCPGGLTGLSLADMRTWKVELRLTAVEIRDSVLDAGPDPPPADGPPPYDFTD